MKKSMNIYGYQVDVEYRIVDGEVEITQTHVKNATYPMAIGSLDIVSEVKEAIEAELLEEEDLANERPLEKDESSNGSTPF